MSNSRDLIATGGLLALALAVGGAGVSFPLLEMLLQIGAVSVAAYFVISRRSWRLRGLHAFAVALLALALILPALQLIPLPPEIWHRLAGRALPRQLDLLLDWQRWRPITLDVEATVRSTLRLIPATVIFLGCLFLPVAQRTRLLWVVVAAGLGGALLGIAQLATGGALTPFPSAHSGFPIGLFVNRNHNAVLLLATIPIVAALGATLIAERDRPLPVIVGVLATIVMLSIAVIATTSRMAVLLLPVALAVAALVLFSARSLWRVALPSMLAFVALAVAVFATGGLDRTLVRFSSLHDSRFDYWTDVHWAVQHYGLAGSGFGTFIPVFQTAESLDAVSDQILNHAHNDYLEILLEGGWAAIALLVLFVVLIAVASIRLMRSRPPAPRALTALAAASGIVVILCFSLVDYPLRMPALSSVFALLCAMLLPGRHAPASVPVPAAEGRPPPLRRAPRARAIRAAVLVVLALLSFVVVQAGLSGSALLARRYDDAVRLAPWSVRAYERRATEALFASEPAPAARDARAALRLSPISAPAVRTLGLVYAARGAPGTGNRLMDIAATLGWRDPITQMWGIDTALRSGESEKALQRAEALFRQRLFPPPALTLVTGGGPDRRVTRLLVARLAQRPPWREEFLRAAGQLPLAPATDYETVIRGLQATPAPASIEEVQPFFAQLVGNRQSQRAQDLWAFLHARELVTNGGFETPAHRAPDVPRYWDRDPAAPGAVLARPAVGSGRALRISGGTGAGAVISQQLMLPPGSYALTFRSHAEGGSGLRLRWELKCRGSGARLASNFAVSPAPDWHDNRSLIHVPQQDCLIQRLALRVSADTNPQAIWIDDVTLRRLSD